MSSTAPLLAKNDDQGQGKVHAGQVKELPKDLREVKAALIKQFGSKKEDGSDQKLDEFNEKMDSMSFYTFAVLVMSHLLPMWVTHFEWNPAAEEEKGALEVKFEENRAAVHAKAHEIAKSCVYRWRNVAKFIMLPVMQIVIPISIMNDTYIQNLAGLVTTTTTTPSASDGDYSATDDDYDSGPGAGWCADNSEPLFRFGGMCFMMYSLWSLLGSIQENASVRLLMDRAKFYEITGQRPNFFLALGFIIQFSSSSIILICFYMMMIQATNLLDITSYMYGINFLIDIDFDWIEEVHVKKGKQLASISFVFKRRAWKDETTILSSMHRDQFLRKHAVKLTRWFTSSLPYLLAVLGYFLVLCFGFCPAKY